MLMSLRLTNRCTLGPLLRLLVLNSFLFLFSQSSLAAPAKNDAGPKGTGKAGKEFFSVGISMNEFRSVELILDQNAGYDSDGDYTGATADVRFPLTAQTWGYLINYGGYINDYFRAEFRAGSGFKKDTFDEALDVNIKYWIGGYLGFQHPITDYMSGHFLYGLTHYEADTTRRQIIIPFQTETSSAPIVVEPSPERMEDGLFDTRFSTSWILGLEISLWQDTYLVLEYGRLLKDTGSNIKVRQAGTHLKFEF
ncbi:MAG: hypothetical protein C9356_00055 [Oleiphilus sp.]|nr:MAG: hypothetical protein C9356_00055 [Oleiphilus sp.]